MVSQRCVGTASLHAQLLVARWATWAESLPRVGAARGPGFLF